MRIQEKLNKIKARIAAHDISENKERLEDPELKLNPKESLKDKNLESFWRKR